MTYEDIRMEVEKHDYIRQKVQDQEVTADGKRTFTRRNVDWTIDGTGDTFVTCHRDVRGKRLNTSFHFGAIICGEVRLV